MIRDGHIGKSNPDFDRSLVEEKLYEMDMYSYKMSSDERRTFILISLLQNKTYSSMQKLAEELYVSRITILSDFENIKEYLEEFEITLVSDAGKGIAIRCGKEKKIELLIELFRKLRSYKMMDFPAACIEENEDPSFFF